jgi:His/Glu/Gln/Arg/opine family amino acid ABC transporter permease subunit
MPSARTKVQADGHPAFGKLEYATQSERDHEVDQQHENVDLGHVTLALDDDLAGEPLEILPRLLAATVVTIEATFGGMAVALVGGLILAMMRMSGSRVLSAVAVGFTEFVRGTPLLIQLFFLFYVLPLYGFQAGALVTGIIGLGIHYSAYTAEVYRAGVESVGRGQWEAAVALNFSTTHTW